MRIKVNGQNVAICVKEYIDARQNVAAAWCLGLVACSFFYFLTGSVKAAHLHAYKYAITHGAH